MNAVLNIGGGHCIYQPASRSDTLTHSFLVWVLKNEFLSVRMPPHRWTEDCLHCEIRADYIFPALMSDHE